jgi:hypothetical protein
METIQVIIEPDGISCKEVNPLGQKPEFKKHIQMYIGDFDELPHYKQKAKVEDWESSVKLWRAAESSLRVFKIDFTHLEEPLKKLVEAAGGTIENVSHVSYGLEPGSQHSAVIVDKDKLIVKIL